tara:strand:+ start:484 stop:606 length:123 start_codon:yes stop_codon:yes gene_type:complete
MAEQNNREKMLGSLHWLLDIEHAFQVPSEEHLERNTAKQV